MAIRFSNVVSRGDLVKIGILLVVAAGCWTWVYREYQKPIVPLEWIQGGEVTSPR